MKLTFDPLDLKPEFQHQTEEGVDHNIPTSSVAYEHLNEAAQAAVRVVGRGVFYTWGKRSYNAVHPPEPKT